ncbi:unnamed protein product, partial [Owenia fusiformis]
MPDQGFHNNAESQNTFVHSEANQPVYHSEIQHQSTDDGFNAYQDHIQGRPYRNEPVYHTELIQDPSKKPFSNIDADYKRQEKSASVYEDNFQETFESDYNEYANDRLVNVTTENKSNENEDNPTLVEELARVMSGRPVQKSYESAVRPEDIIPNKQNAEENSNVNSAKGFKKPHYTTQGMDLPGHILKQMGLDTSDKIVTYKPETIVFGESVLPTKSSPKDAAVHKSLPMVLTTASSSRTSKPVASLSRGQSPGSSAEEASQSQDDTTNVQGETSELDYNRDLTLPKDAVQGLKSVKPRRASKEEQIENERKFNLRKVLYKGFAEADAENESGSDDDSIYNLVIDSDVKTDIEITSSHVEPSTDQKVNVRISTLNDDTRKFDVIDHETECDVNKDTFGKEMNDGNKEEDGYAIVDGIEINAKIYDEFDEEPCNDEAELEEGEIPDDGVEGNDLVDKVHENEGTSNTLRDDFRIVVRQAEGDKGKIDRGRRISRDVVVQRRQSKVDRNSKVNDRTKGASSEERTVLIKNKEPTGRSKSKEKRERSRSKERERRSRSRSRGRRSKSEEKKTKDQGMRSKSADRKKRRRSRSPNRRRTPDRRRSRSPDRRIRDRGRRSRSRSPERNDCSRRPIKINRSSERTSRRDRRKNSVEVVDVSRNKSSSLSHEKKPKIADRSKQNLKPTTLLEDMISKNAKVKDNTTEVQNSDAKITSENFIVTKTISTMAKDKDTILIEDDPIVVIEDDAIVIEDDTVEKHKSAKKAMSSNIDVTVVSHTPTDSNKAKPKVKEDIPDMSEVDKLNKLMELQRILKEEQAAREQAREESLSKRKVILESIPAAAPSNKTLTPFVASLVTTPEIPSQSSNTRNVVIEPKPTEAELSKEQKRKVLVNALIPTNVIQPPWPHPKHQIGTPKISFINEGPDGLEEKTRKTSDKTSDIGSDMEIDESVSANNTPKADSGRSTPKIVYVNTETPPSKVQTPPSKVQTPTAPPGDVTPGNIQPAKVRSGSGSSTPSSRTSTPKITYVNESVKQMPSNTTPDSSVKPRTTELDEEPVEHITEDATQKQPSVEPLLEPSLKRSGGVGTPKISFVGSSNSPSQRNTPKISHVGPEGNVKLQSPKISYVGSKLPSLSMSNADLSQSWPANMSRTSTPDRARSNSIDEQTLAKKRRLNDEQDPEQNITRRVVLIDKGDDDDASKGPPVIDSSTKGSSNTTNYPSTTQDFVDQAANFTPAVPTEDLFDTAIGYGDMDHCQDEQTETDSEDDIYSSMDCVDPYNIKPSDSVSNHGSDDEDYADTSQILPDEFVLDTSYMSERDSFLGDDQCSYLGASLASFRTTHTSIDMENDDAVSIFTTKSTIIQKRKKASQDSSAAIDDPDDTLILNEPMEIEDPQDGGIVETNPSASPSCHIFGEPMMEGLSQLHARAKEHAKAAQRRASSGQEAIGSSYSQNNVPEKSREELEIDRLNAKFQPVIDLCKIGNHNNAWFRFKALTKGNYVVPTSKVLIALLDVFASNKMLDKSTEVLNIALGLQSIPTKVCERFIELWQNDKDRTMPQFKYMIQILQKHNQVLSAVYMDFLLQTFCRANLWPDFWRMINQCKVHKVQITPAVAKMCMLDHVGGDNRNNDGHRAEERQGEQTGRGNTSIGNYIQEISNSFHSHNATNLLRLYKMVAEKSGLLKQCYRKAYADGFINLGCHGNAMIVKIQMFVKGLMVKKNAHNMPEALRNNASYTLGRILSPVLQHVHSHHQYMLGLKVLKLCRVHNIVWPKETSSTHNLTYVIADLLIRDNNEQQAIDILNEFNWPSPTAESRALRYTVLTSLLESMMSQKKLSTSVKIFSKLLDTRKEDEAVPSIAAYPLKVHEIYETILNTSLKIGDTENFLGIFRLQSSIGVKIPMQKWMNRILVTLIADKNIKNGRIWFLMSVKEGVYMKSVGNILNTKTIVVNCGHLRQEMYYMIEEGLARLYSGLHAKCDAGRKLNVSDFQVNINIMQSKDRLTENSPMLSTDTRKEAVQERIRSVLLDLLKPPIKCLRTDDGVCVVPQSLQEHFEMSENHYRSYEREFILQQPREMVGPSHPQPQPHESQQSDMLQYSEPHHSATEAHGAVLPGQHDAIETQQGALLPRQHAAIKIQQGALLPRQHGAIETQHGALLP